MPKDWLNIRVKTERSNIRKVQATILGHPEKVFTKYYFQELQGITAAAADVMRYYTKSDPRVYTKTGKARKANGSGEEGRYVTGEMFDHIKWVGEKMSNGKYRFKFGWLQGEPGYAVFQEYGTKNGLVGMHALLYAQEFARREIKYMASGGTGTSFGKTYKEF